MGRGGWEGGGEVTFLTQYQGNGETLRAIAKFAKKHNQDGVLIQKYTTEDDPAARPQNRIGFKQPVDNKLAAKVESMLVEVGFGGWTWGRANGRTTLMLACVPQWGGGEKQAHLQMVSRLQEGLSRMGLSFNAEKYAVQVEVMERENYDDYIRR